MIPTGKPVSPLMIIAIPFAPPVAILLGMRKETSPTAVRKVPKKETMYSFKTFLFKDIPSMLKDLPYP